MQLAHSRQKLKDQPVLLDLLKGIRLGQELLPFFKVELEPLAEKHDFVIELGRGVAIVK